MNKNELRVILAKEYVNRSFYNFFKYLFDQVESDDFIDNYHIKLLCDTLEQRFRLYYKETKGNVLSREELKYKKDILINLPPSASKSLIVSVFFPVWIWWIRPTTKIITISYSHSVAEMQSSKSLKLLTSIKMNELLVLSNKYKMVSFAVGMLKNNVGGYRMVTSTGGTITGFHGDVILCDDLNSPTAMHSETDRNLVETYLKQVLPSRRTNLEKSFFVYVQQRFHVGDASGILLENPDKYNHIKISAFDEEGKSFFPKRFPINYLEEVKKDLGTIQFNAQYMQNVIDLQGGIIKKDWINEIELDDNNKKLTYFIDTAYGGKNADYNCIMGCYVKDNNLIISYLEINKFEFPELINWIIKNIPNYSTCYIEGKASGKSIIQVLRKQTNLNINETQPTSSKLERKQSISPFFESNRIFINKFIKHKDNLIDQILFDNTKNDDIMDTIIMGIENLILKQKGARFSVL